MSFLATKLKNSLRSCTQIYEISFTYISVIFIIICIVFNIIYKMLMDNICFEICSPVASSE